MKKNVYLIIITAITVLCIIGGSLYHLIGLGIQNHRLSVREVERVEFQSDLEAFTSIDATMSVTDLNIQLGNTYSISFSGNKEIEPQYHVENGVLVITQKDPKPTIGINNHSINNNACNTVITIPANANALDTLTLNCNVGDVDIAGINVDTLKITADVGDIDIDNCTGKEIIVNGSVGDIDLAKNDFLATTVSADVGDVDIIVLGSLSDYNLDITADIGEVEVNHKKHKKEYHASAASEYSIKATGSVGDISVN